MSALQVASFLIVLAGTFGTINYLFLKLPSAIGILVVALLASLTALVSDALWPALSIAETLRAIVLDIDFSDALLEGMLGLLLFAGALHVKLSELRAQWSVVLLMATIGVTPSTLVVGVGVGVGHELSTRVQTIIAGAEEPLRDGRKRRADGAPLPKRERRKSVA